MKRILTLLAGIALSMSIPAGAAAQDGYEVKGVIVDAIGPVVGATVMESGTTTGTVSDLDGNYALTVSSADATVEVSCIGYATQTLHRLRHPDLQGIGNARDNHSVRGQ